MSKMTAKDVGAASDALINWLESQDMSGDECVRVLTTTLVAVIYEIAVTTGKDAKEGGRIITGIIMESLP